MVTRTRAAFEDEQLDAALLSILGDSDVTVGDAIGLGKFARSLAGSRRASATLGIAAAGAIASLAFLTLAHEEARDAPRVRPPAPSQRALATSVDGALATIVPAPVAPAPAVALTGSSPRSTRRPAASSAALASVVRAPERSAASDEVTHPPDVALTDHIVTAIEPAAIAISVPAAPSPEPATSLLVDTGPPPTSIAVGTQRARRDSVAAMRSFRRQW
ncbi:hypothetical protein ACMGDM_11360 [Sphingomonas sp. DT-51]|uniref:hypothetical protein n=1 Tax=Sphingomonas sp. DT-51 TaxID=3396165 RepID=UPI003F19C72B